MDNYLEKLTNHVSVRDFKNISLSAKIKKRLITSARSASSSNFLQSFSIIEISDTRLKEELAAIAGNSLYVKKMELFMFLLLIYIVNRNC